MGGVKVWAKRSYETANIIVTFGLTLGAIPVKWNKEGNRMEPVTSRREVFRWVFSTVYISCWQVAICVNFVRMVLALDMESGLAFAIQDAMRFGVVGSCSVVFFVNLHTAWKYLEFVAFINRAAGFYEYFQSKYAKKEERRGFTKEDTISAIIKISFLCLMIMVAGLAVLAYLLQCRRHILFQILPICTTAYPLYVKIPVKIFGSLFQFHFIAVMAAGIILYVDLFAAVVLMGLYIVREMREIHTEKRRTNRRLFAPAEWLRCFRCLELIVKELNDCIGDLFMPLHMLVIVWTTALGILALIRYDLEPMLLAIVVLILAFIALYYVFLIGRGSYFCQASRLALESIQGKMDTEYLNRKHRACRVLKPNVGGLFPLRQHTVATMYQSSIELASNLLLMK